MPRATRDGVSIYYEYDESEGDGTPVVFVQGLGYGRWMWRWQREAVADDRDVIAPDNRGTGRSDAGLPPLLPRLPRKLRAPLLFKLAGYSIGGLAADLEEVLADAGIRRAHVVGASMGGMIAQRYALEYTRAETLTLCCTSHGGPDAVPVPDETQEFIFDVPDGANERETIRHRMRPAFTERFTNRNPHLMDRIIEWRLEQDADDPAREAQAAAVLDFDVSDRLEGLRVPTLVLHGTDDRVVPFENGLLLEEAIPNARLERFEGGSHCFFIEHADRVNEELRAFLADHD
ncbi:alpha/beta hydrolase fold protein [Haloterrigena turkmenica DSM 5511]|uniref:Alpha/beta hydrolase fold protein n=1 Tax=Haloterrigena turkmenica (strain ATCC 51198 / DSM 5511 / JCM 9101 / NCIMB 13204 / VKM B-1734 / 4k) TaxID=543526 RepID=D2RTL8_HALTV|nr:alpha/beta hydrolase [Haloterrigena turkmenica]ADB59061.1 alpha/beta hydrolase fold protein [Haloterrigena turkmenica DSM 5511]